VAGSRPDPDSAPGSSFRCAISADASRTAIGSSGSARVVSADGSPSAGGSASATRAPGLVLGLVLGAGLRTPAGDQLVYQASAAAERNQPSASAFDRVVSPLQLCVLDGLRHTSIVTAGAGPASRRRNPNWQQVQKSTN